MDNGTRSRWLEAVADLLARSHLMQSDEVAAHLVDAVGQLGVEVTLASRPT